MVTGTHPDDVELFDYVEGILPASERAALEVHLAACALCAEQVARVQAGRDALRESQFLQLPPRRRDEIFLNLPPERREARRLPLSAKQLIAVLTPAAAIAAIAVALVTTGGNGNEFGAGAAGTNEATAGATAGSEAAGGEQAPQDRAGKKALLSVAGPAEAVAAELRSKGFDAEVVGKRVEVRNATRREVMRALRGRRDGTVRILMVH